MGDNSVTAATVLLAALLFSAILACEKSFAVEQQNDCTSALLLAAADAGDIYIGKLLVNIALIVFAVTKNTGIHSNRHT